jgi:hypothetical protein
LQKIKDSMDLWVEAFDTFGAATLMMSEAFKGFFAFKPSVDSDMPQPTASPFLDVSLHFVEVAKKLNRVILPSVRQLFELRCLQPTASILALVGPIDALLQERKTVLLDFDSYRARIEKEHAAGRDSRHPLVVKKAAKLDEVAKQLHSLNTTIRASFAEFEKARLITMGPEFTACIACFFHFASYSTELSGKIVPGLPQIASSLYILESFIGQSFADLQNLTVSIPVIPSSAPGETEESEDEPAPAGVVLSRSEYGGGGYGGYSTYSTVLTSGSKEGAGEPTAAVGSDAADESAKEEARSATTEDWSQHSASSGLSSEELSAPGAFSGGSGMTAIAVPVLVPPTSGSPALDRKKSVSPPTSPSTSSKKLPIPVAETVDAAASVQEAVPLATAVLDLRPPKPAKYPTPNRSSSPVPGMSALSAPSPSGDTNNYRNTISFAKGSSGGGDMSEDLAHRRPMDASPAPLTPPPKPAKPPKPSSISKPQATPVGSEKPEESPRPEPFTPQSGGSEETADDAEQSTETPNTQAAAEPTESAAAEPAAESPSEPTAGTHPAEPTTAETAPEATTEAASEATTKPTVAAAPEAATKAQLDCCIEVCRD